MSLHRTTPSASAAVSVDLSPGSIAQPYLVVSHAQSSRSSRENRREGDDEDEFIMVLGAAQSERQAATGGERA